MYARPTQSATGATALLFPSLDKISKHAKCCINWGAVREARVEFERLLQLAEHETGQPLRQQLAQTATATGTASGTSPLIPTALVSTTHYTLPCTHNTVVCMSATIAYVREVLMVHLNSLSYRCFALY
jgi:hypothetical protein